MTAPISKSQAAAGQAAPQVREAMQASMTAWAVRRVQGDQAWVTLAPRPAALAAYLDQAGAAWSLRWACDSVTPPVVRACLSIGGSAREGLAAGHTLEDAKLAALADALGLWGLVSPEGQWVDYGPEDGANTADLEAEAAASAPPPRLAPLPPEPPRDPQMEKARTHINELIAQIEAAGLGKQVARVVMKGYGSTVEESRQIYKELQAIMQGAAAEGHD